ncbi:MAG: MFS transporter [Clostridia bacterium]|nr:MFS transporter [Clostridia bacterium]
MSQLIRSRAKAIAWTLMLVYFASYVTRINFAGMMVKICSDMNMEKTALAIVVTGLTVTYGVGQIISGFMGDKIRAEYMIMGGLMIAGLANIAMTFCQSVVLMTVVWCINGFAQAMLWPPIVRLMSTHLTDVEYGYAAVRVSWGSSFATVLLYLVCPLLLYVMNWRAVMLCCAVLGLGVMVLWRVLYPKLLVDPIAVSKGNEEGKAEKAAAIPLPRFVYLPVVLIMLGILMQGVLRDGVTNWMPFYMQETFGIPEENAIISTVVLAIFSVVSFSFFDLLHRRVFKNEVFCSAVIFLASAICSVVLYFANAANAPAVVPMLFMAIIVACMHGINLMLITIVPKRFIKSGKVSTYSGILNAFTYVGAALSTYGFAALADAFGWGVTILTWVIVSLVGLLLCLVATPLWRRFRSEYCDR